MPPVIMEQPLRRRISSNPRPSGSAFAYLLIVLMSAFGIVSVDYGFSVLTALPFLIGLIVAVIHYSTKMYFIRHQPPQEQMVSGGWDRVVGYSVTAFFFVALASYELYEFSFAKSAASATRQSIRLQLLEPVAPATGPSPESFESTGEERARLEPPIRAFGADDASTDSPISGLEGFIKATLAQSNTAIGCWLALGLMEIIIGILIRHNRPRYYYDWE
jgi:hypothetical protein